MAMKTLRVLALATAFTAVGALAAAAAPDDEIKYRDGKPVGQQAESSGSSADAADKPAMKKATKSSSKKSMKKKKTKKRKAT